MTDQNQKEIHVEGLPFDWTEEDLKKQFAACGEIQSVKMPTWHDSGRSKGYGFVTFADSNSVDEALKLNKTEVDGRWLNVALATGASDSRKGNSKFQSFSSSPEEDCKTLFVKNLPYDVTEDQIGDTFSSYGKIESVRIATDQGRVKGFCFIEFEDSNSVKNVADASKKGTTFSINGRDLVADYGNGKPKAGFHPRSESYNSRFPGTPVSKHGGIERRGKGFGKGFGKGKGKGKGKGYRRD